MYNNCCLFWNYKLKSHLSARETNILRGCCHPFNQELLAPSLRKHELHPRGKSVQPTRPKIHYPDASAWQPRVSHGP